MKKISTIFMMAICAVALMSVTSCKDYDDDHYSEVVIPQVNVEELLNKQKKELQDQIDALKAQLENIKSCTCTGGKTCDCDQKWKDNEKAMKELNDSLAKMQKDLENLQKELKALSDKVDGITIPDTSKLEKEVGDLKKEIEDLKKEIEDLKKGLPSGSGCECDLTSINNTLTTLNTAVTNIQTALVGKADKATVDALSTTVTNLSNEFNTKVQNFENRIATLEAARIVIEKDIEDLKAADEKIDATINVVKGDVANLTNTVATVQETITEVQTTLGTVKSNLESLTTKVEGIDERLKALEAATHEPYDDTELRNLISALQETVKGLSQSVAVLQSQMTAVQTKAAAALGKAEANEAWIDAMKALYGENLENLLDNVNPDLSGYATVGELADSIAKLRGEAEALAEAAKTEAKTYADEVAKAITNRVDSLAGVTNALDLKIEQLDAAYKAADVVLQNQINALDTRVSDLEDRMTAAENKLLEVSGLLDALQNRINSQITSIIVQSVTTPLFLDANIALPIGLQTNVICAYYGEVQNGETWFPSSSKSFNLSDDDEILTDEEIEEFDIDETHYYQGDRLESTGGKVYLTINPSNVNFTGAGLKLVDSQNGASGFLLENVKKSDKVLSFMSRSADNGFYEADVNLDKNFDRAKFNTAPLKAAAKDVYTLLKNRTGVRDMATSVVKAAYKSVNLPAYAVQAKYSWEDENGNMQNAFVHSNYNIAATAIHPLTYNFSGKLGNYTSKIPQKFLRQIPYLSKKILESGSWQSIKAKLYFEFNEVDKDKVETFNVSISNIEFLEGEEVIKVTVNYDKPTGVSGNDIVWGENNGQTTVLISGKDLDRFSEVINDAIQTDIEKLNLKVNDLQVKFVDAVNDALENTADTLNNRAKDIIKILEDLAKKSDSYVDRVNKLIDKVNNQLQKVYNRLENVDHYLLPIMFYGNSKGDLHRFSSYESTASYVTAGHMVLYPTSYTAEILNPAAKKMIKVTKAKKLSTGKNDPAEVAAANASYDGLNKVIDGSTRAVGLEVKSGYAYEIAYSALDYTGYQVTQRYWVKVK